MYIVLHYFITHVGQIKVLEETFLRAHFVWQMRSCLHTRDCKSGRGHWPAHTLCHWFARCRPRPAPRWRRLLAGESAQAGRARRPPPRHAVQARKPRWLNRFLALGILRHGAFISLLEFRPRRPLSASKSLVASKRGAYSTPPPRPCQLSSGGTQGGAKEGAGKTWHGGRTGNNALLFSSNSKPPRPRIHQ